MCMWKQLDKNSKLQFTVNWLKLPISDHSNISLNQEGRNAFIGKLMHFPEQKQNNFILWSTDTAGF